MINIIDHTYKKLLIINFFLLAIASIFGGYYYLYRIPIDSMVLYDVLKAISLSFILLNLPDIICYYTRSKYYGMMTLLVLLFSSLIGFIIPINPLWVMLLAIILFFHQAIRLFDFFPLSNLKSYWIVLTMIIIIVVGLGLVKNFYGQRYHHPLFIEKMALGLGNIDTLYHSGISNMFLNYYIPTTGLHGIKYLHYHYGSHIIFGGLSKLIDLKPLVFYNLAYPICFIIIFFKSLFIAIIKFQEYYKRNSSIIFLLLFVFGFTLYFFPDGSPFVSESYTVGISFSFLFLSDIFLFIEHAKERKNLYIRMLLYYTLAFIILISLKISVAFLFFVMITYLFLREFSFKNWLFLVFILANAIYIYWWFKLFGDMNKPIIPFKETLESNKLYLTYYVWPYFILIIYLILNKISLNAAGYQKIKEKFVSKDFILLEALFIVSLISPIPSFIEKTLDVSDIFYFVSYQIFLGLIIGIPFLIKLLPERFFSFDMKQIKIFVLCVITFYILFPFQLLCAKRPDIKEEKYSIILKAVSTHNYSFLKKLSTYHFKSNSAFYISKENIEFWKMQKIWESGIYFYIPSLTGLSQLFAIPEDMDSQIGYGFITYKDIVLPKSEKEVIEEAKRLGYSYLYVVDRNLKIREIDL